MILRIVSFLQRAYDTHALVYWPSTTGASAEAVSGATHEYGVVFVPGTGAGVGPAYRHRPARNKYAGPVDIETFHPDHEVSFANTRLHCGLPTGGTRCTHLRASLRRLFSRIPQGRSLLGECRPSN